jgi:hypothetical protein
MFNRKIDYSNMKNYLSIDKYFGTIQYWKEKYGEKFDIYTYEIMEILSKIDSGEKQDQLILEVKERQNEFYKKLCNEFINECN